MKKILHILIPIFLIIYFAGCAKSEEKEKVDTSSTVKAPTQKTVLWNGKDLSDWKLVLEDPTVAVNTVWSVNNGIITCIGVPKGYMRTKTKWTDYKLHAEWRWTEEPGNSGVLIHCQEPDNVWPLCIEAQLQAGNAGDFIMMGGATVSEQESPEKRRITRKEDSSEKEAGEWNTYDIICDGGKIDLYVNGVLQNSATGASVTSGTIAFQSEGKPIEFTNLYVEPIN